MNLIYQLKMRLAFVLLANQLGYACNHKPAIIIEEVNIVDIVEDTTVLPPPSSVGISFIDPTGSYTIDHKTTLNGEIYGYWGEVKVKLVEKEKILLSLTIYHGAQNNNSSGSCIDTLKYDNNIAVYAPSGNPTCEIRFRFTDEGVDVVEELFDLHSDCFGKHDVFAGGFYKKISKEF